jgi:hypothetical protein
MLIRLCYNFSGNVVTEGSPTTKSGETHSLRFVCEIDAYREESRGGG